MSSNSSQIEADAEYARRLQEEEIRSATFLMGPSFLPDRRRAPYFLSGGAGSGAPPPRNSGAAAAAAHNSSNSRASPSTNPAGGVPDRAPAPYAYTPAREEGPSTRPQTHTHHHFQYFHQTGGPANEPGHGAADVMDAFDHLHMIFPGFPRMTPNPPGGRRARRPPFGGGGPPGAVDAMAEMSRLMGEFPSFFNDDAFGHPNAHGGGGAGASFFATGGELPAFFRNILGHHPNTYEEFLEMIERRGGNVNRGAGDDEIANLPTEKYQPKPRGASSAAGAAAGAEDAEKCVICLGEYERDEEVRRLPCDHIFHSECIDRWLKVNRTCPSCKRSIRPSDTEQQQ